MRRFIRVTAVLSILATLSLSSARGGDVQLLRRDGSPVNWGTNTVFFGNPPKTGASFNTELGANGTIVAAGLYKIRMSHNKASSPDPQVRISGTTFTIDASLIDESLRGTGGLAWSQGQLFAAEWHANDCTDRYVCRFDSQGQLAQRLETVLHPTDLAVADGTLYVLGSEELAALSLAGNRRLWTTPLAAIGGGAQHLALLAGRLYITSPERHGIVRVEAASGKVLDTLPLAGVAPGARGEALPIAATPGGTLLVGLPGALVELNPQGEQLRRVAEIKDPLALAVSPRGEIAVAGAAPNGACYVLRLDATGKPLLKIAKTSWNDFGNEPCDCRYFTGLLGKLHWVGGLAFDPEGNLFVADRNDIPKADGSLRGLAKDMGQDGGIVKLSPGGDVLARLGSRFSDGSIIAARLAERRQRDPLLRTRKLLAEGGRSYITVYGDSITQIGGDWNGGASDTAHNWAMLLPGLIAQRQPAAKVLMDARGIGGNTVFNGLCRAPQPEQVDLDAALYLLEFGTNDVNRPSVPPERYAAGLREFVRMLFVYTDADVALVTTGPMPGDNLRNPEEYRRAVKSVAVEFGIPAVDITAAIERALAGREFPTLHLGNEPGRKKTDAHPNTEGHAVWAQATVDTLVEAVAKSTPGGR